MPEQQVVIDSDKASIQVHPDTTTKYMVSLQLCGGEVSYDTVTVWVATEGLPFGKLTERVWVWPNPVSDELNISNGAGSDLKVYDMVGKQVLQVSIIANQQTVDISNLWVGVYVVNVLNRDGERKTFKVVKE